ncbi:NAD-dependent epimerase/dehydratase [Calothrix sp. NIES-4071]|nr:NAD-dependent epimerase/dehydratase [Calothrix sp. NIES-4071]BAZ54804.1 NAD-dependent epimerase/dehydratase [Calothrix sp. NIES-4105]
MIAVNVSPDDIVLVAGATGGVGQLTVAKLLEKGLKVRALTRNPGKVATMFDNRVEVAEGDILNPDSLQNAVRNVKYILCCTGTTAFPSDKWQFNSNWNWFEALFDSQKLKQKAANTPEKVDFIGVTNLVNAAPRDLKRFVFVSSCGIHRKNSFPFSILNAFGVLDAKEKGEQSIINSGLPYTIIRPVRLIDGPYTSYDLNTLLKATTQGKLGVVIDTGDKVVGETSRIDVAAACVECLTYTETENKVFELVNQGRRPQTIDWQTLFTKLTN